MQYFVPVLTFSIVNTLWFSALVGLVWVLCWEPVNQNKSFLFMQSNEVFQAFETEISFLVVVTSTPPNGSDDLRGAFVILEVFPCPISST